MSEQVDWEARCAGALAGAAVLRSDLAAALQRAERAEAAYVEAATAMRAELKARCDAEMRAERLEADLAAARGERDRLRAALQEAERKSIDRAFGAFCCNVCTVRSHSRVEGDAEVSHMPDCPFAILPGARVMEVAALEKANG